MNHPEADRADMLRDRLDRLADSVSGGDGIDGAQLYRQGVRRRRRRVVAATGIVAAGVLAAGAAFAAAVQPGASPTIGPATSPSSPPESDCELTGRYAELVELGAMTKEEACQSVQRAEEAIEARQANPDVVEELSLSIAGTVNESWVSQCRDGSFDSGEGAEANELYCNAIVKIADGELKPTRICDPPECSEPGTPLWEYDETQLRDLAQ